MISTVARLNIALVVVVVLVVAVAASLASLPLYRPQAALPAYCAQGQAEINLTASAAYAEDIVTGEVLYQKNASAQLPLASLTKVMTALTVSELLPEGTLVVVTKEALEPEGNSGLLENETWKLEDLIDFTLMASVNDGARALSLAAAVESGHDLDWFVRAMNTKAETLGLPQTYFLNDTGLDVSSTTAGAYGSAENVARLLSYAVSSRNSRIAEGSTVASRTFVSLDQTTHEAENTSTAGVFLENAIFSKTGFTDLAGGNLGVVFEPFLGRPVAAVVLGSTREGREDDIRLLGAAAKKELKRKIACQEWYGR